MEKKIDTPAAGCGCKTQACRCKTDGCRCNPCTCKDCQC
jgi:hypothetical protein